MTCTISWKRGMKMKDRLEDNRIEVHTVKIFSSKDESSIVIATDASNEVMRRIIKESIKRNHSVFEVVRFLKLAGFMSKLLYDYRSDPEHLETAVGYSISYDIDEPAELLFNEGRNYIFDQIRAKLDGKDGIRILEYDEDCIIIKVRDIPMEFILKVEES